MIPQTLKRAIKEYCEQPNAHKFDNMGGMDRFPRSVIKLIQEEMGLSKQSSVIVK